MVLALFMILLLETYFGLVVVLNITLIKQTVFHSLITTIIIKHKCTQLGHMMVLVVTLIKSLDFLLFLIYQILVPALDWDGQWTSGGNSSGETVILNISFKFQDYNGNPHSQVSNNYGTANNQIVDAKVVDDLRIRIFNSQPPDTTGYYDDDGFLTYNSTTHTRGCRNNIWC